MNVRMSKCLNYLIIGAFKETAKSDLAEELNAHMSSSFRRNRELKFAKDVIKSYGYLFVDL